MVAVDYNYIYILFVFPAQISDLWYRPLAGLSRDPKFFKASER